jgi:hypothetical protein
MPTSRPASAAAATRWSDPVTVTLVAGRALAYLQEVCRYSAEEYDWPAPQARLNAVPQFRTDLDGVPIHFLRVRSPQPDALALVLYPRWPGAMWEFLDVLGPLTHPAAHGGDPADLESWRSSGHRASAPATLSARSADWCPRHRLGLLVHRLRGVVGGPVLGDGSTIAAARPICACPPASRSRTTSRSRCAIGPPHSIPTSGREHEAGG